MNKVYATLTVALLIVMGSIVAIPWLFAINLDRKITRANGFNAGTCWRLATTYFSKPSRQQFDAFVLNDLAEQYAIYICGNQYMEPAMNLMEPFASEGERAATYLRDKLAKSNNDSTTRDIVMVFSDMKRQHSYDVSAERPIMLLMKQKQQAMSDKFWRDYVSNEISQIER